MSASLGLPTNRMTMLRILRHRPFRAASTPRILGVDDWAYRRGKTYGTVLVDLDRSTPVDRLPDRQAATLAAWLQQHPARVLISRDRAGEDASGATQGAPEAIQSADRFHVVRNLADTMERALPPHRKALKQIHVVTLSAPAPSLLLRYPRPDREQDSHQRGIDATANRRIDASAA